MSVWSLGPGGGEGGGSGRGRGSLGVGGALKKGKDVMQGGLKCDLK